jgi:sugar phosphate isomerase/epimerase
MHRRDLLRWSAGAALAALPRLPASTAARRLDRIGVQLYTVRREMARDFDGTLFQLGEIGYHEVEFHDYFGRAPEAVQAALARANLVAPAIHVPFERLRDGWDRVLGTAAQVGHRAVLVAWVPAEERADLDGWRRVAELFNRAGAAARALGLRFAYHNHDFEFAPLQGQIPYDVLLAATDPALVGFELDLYWITKGGQDPLAYFARHPRRFEFVHIKDSAGPPDHRMVDLGCGTIDFRRIFAQSRQAGIRHYFAEHDQPADPLEFCRTAFRYLNRLRF